MASFNGLKIGIFVYHRDVYNARERLEIVGIRKKTVELEGDYSGGTHNVKQSCWLPIEGVCFEYNKKLTIKVPCQKKNLKSG